MADSEFEEFRDYFEKIPQHIKATAQTYTLVHDVIIDEEFTDEKNKAGNPVYQLRIDRHIPKKKDASHTAETDLSHSPQKNIKKDNTATSAGKEQHSNMLQFPTNKKPSGVTSLAEELGEVNSTQSVFVGTETPLLMSYIKDPFYSSDSEQFDSGTSTSHSPDTVKLSTFPSIRENLVGETPLAQIDLLQGTHRALHKFMARHSDELELEIGDPIYVEKEAEDLWCEGINLKTGQQGIFPSAYVVDVEYNDLDSTNPRSRRERFLLDYMGSVETLYHKGNSVLRQAINKITQENKAQPCVLEVSDQGLHMFDVIKPKRENCSLDYFYSLKNVSFCAFHPQDQQYMGFITKHPRCDTFACHVFHGKTSTRPVAECVGRAFERFYKKYIETAYPIEDIYLE